LHGACPAIFLNEAPRQMIDKLRHPEVRETPLWRTLKLL